MSILMRKVLGFFAVVVTFMMEGAIIVATGIGLSTTGQDAADLPKWIQWLIDTPWWVPAVLIPGGLLAFSARVFRPDMSAVNEMRALREKSQKDNDRAWAFSAEHYQAKDELKATLEGIVSDIQALKSTVDSMSDSLRGEMSGKIAELDELKRDLNAQMKTHQDQQAPYRRSIQDQIDGFRGLVEGSALRAEDNATEKVKEEVKPEIDALKAEIAALKLALEGR